MDEVTVCRGFVAPAAAASPPPLFLAAKGLARSGLAAAAARRVGLSSPPPPLPLSDPAGLAPVGEAAPVRPLRRVGEAVAADCGRGDARALALITVAVEVRAPPDMAAPTLTLFAVPESDVGAEAVGDDDAASGGGGAARRLSAITFVGGGWSLVDTPTNEDGAEGEDSLVPCWGCDDDEEGAVPTFGLRIGEAVAGRGQLGLWFEFFATPPPSEEEVSVFGVASASSAAVGSSAAGTALSEGSACVRDGGEALLPAAATAASSTAAGGSVATTAAAGTFDGAFAVPTADGCVRGAFAEEATFPAATAAALGARAGDAEALALAFATEILARANAAADAPEAEAEADSCDEGEWGELLSVVADAGETEML